MKTEFPQEITLQEQSSTVFMYSFRKLYVHVTSLYRHGICVHLYVCLDMHTRFLVNTEMGTCYNAVLYL